MALLHSDMAVTVRAPVRARGLLATREARLVAGVLLLAASVRFAALGVQSLDADEGFTAEMAHKTLGGALAQVPHTESTPPLYYAMVWFSTKLAGTSEWSALAGTATVGVVYLIGATLRSARAGLAAAALAAVSPLLVWYSQEARAYMLFLLLAALSFLAFARALRGEPRWLGWWALASAAALATHYFAAVTVLPEAVWLVARAPSRRRAAAAAGAVVAVGLALLPLALDQSEHVWRPWSNTLSVSDGLLATAQSFLVGIPWTWLIHRPGVAVLAAIGATLAVLLWRRGEPDDHRAAAVPLAVVRSRCPS